MERTYTVAEIAALRAACHRKVCRDGFQPRWSAGLATGWQSELVNGEEWSRRAEDMLRTYMLAGITADELDAEFFAENRQNASKIGGAVLQNTGSAGRL